MVAALIAALVAISTGFLVVACVAGASEAAAFVITGICGVLWVAALIASFTIDEGGE